MTKFKAFMDLGRVQGAPLTIAVSLVGALTASPGPSLYLLLWLAIVGVFAHQCAAAVNELWDAELDAASDELAAKPLVKGTLSKKQAKWYAGLTGAIALLAGIFFFGLPAFMALSIACLWAVWYSTHGKRTCPGFDFGFAVAYAMYALFGALAAGRPTMFTWAFLPSIGLMSVFAQWENGLKDVGTDRRFRIRSFAVLGAVSPENGLSWTDPYFIYGAGVKLGFLACCTAPVFLAGAPLPYVLILVAVGYPAQVLILRRFLERSSRGGYVTSILMDVLLSWLLVSAIVIFTAGPFAYVGLLIFIILGYFIGSRLQSEAEYKFLKIRLRMANV